MKDPISIKKILSKALVMILGLLTISLTIYIFGLPFYPEIKYYLEAKQENQDINSQMVETPASTTPTNSTSTVAPSTLPSVQPTTSERKGNYLIIPKIGVDIPIVDSADSRWALNRGAWRMPQTSTPDKGSNTAIAGHRFKYLPPSNLTFYLLDKLVPGDQFHIIWEGKLYYYRVTENKIVPPTQVSVLDPTEKSIVTLITCDPIFTQKNRLIVVGELID
jgi:sortase A